VLKRLFALFWGQDAVGGVLNFGAYIAGDVLGGPYDGRHRRRVVMVQGLEMCRQASIQARGRKKTAMVEGGWIIYGFSRHMETVVARGREQETLERGNTVEQAVPAVVDNALRMMSTRKSRTSAAPNGLRPSLSRIHRPDNSANSRSNFFDRNTNDSNRQAQHTSNNMAEKKRKRNEEGGERPSKKAAVAPKGNVKVELLQEEALGPLLGMSHRALSIQ
jgi:hypothetical protein